MKIIDRFDVNSNFWEVNPQLQVAGPFKKLYTSDKSRGKMVSSKLMWTIALIWDRGSKYYSQPEEGPDGKIALLFEDFFGDKDYYKNNKEKVEELKVFYLTLQETVAEKTLRNIEEKLKERDMFIKKTEYTLGEQGDKGFMYGTVDILDRMMANTKKYYDLWDEARKAVVQENEMNQTLGGGQNSLSDTGEI